jgi:two-component system copper resistance phosphate regulon response regulator CusR
MRILLVEDDPHLASVLESGLGEHGFHVARESSADAGRSRAVPGAFDVIILDVMLPVATGSTSVALRERGVGTPVLMLTAKDTVDDRVQGLESGADDYLTKPFAFRELVARLRALARRPPTPIPERTSIADLEIDLGAHRVRRGGRDIELTAKEFALLEFLVRNHDQVVDRAPITAHVWDENHDPFTNVLEVLVRRLRRKIDDGFDLKLIHTLRGAGYRLGV